LGYELERSLYLNALKLKLIFFKYLASTLSKQYFNQHPLKYQLLGEKQEDLKLLGSSSKVRETLSQLTKSK
jgi:hypothetical protein